MFFSGRSKQLPYFSEYLQAVQMRSSAHSKRLGWAGGVLGAVAGITGAIFGILAGTGVIAPTPVEVGGIVLGLQALTWSGFGWFYLSEKRKAEAKIPNRDLLKEVKPILGELMMSLNKRRLHRDLSPTAALLLEEGARQWTRVMRALGSAFWQDEDLADHWKSIRDHAAAGADRAMLELVLLLQTGFQPNSGPQGWQAMVVEVVEQLGGTVHIERGDDLLPVTFDQARETVSILAELADEVERSSKELLSMGSDEANDLLRSRLAMSQTLQELRSVRQAEEELRQNLGE